MKETPVADTHVHSHAICYGTMWKGGSLYWVLTNCTFIHGQAGGDGQGRGMGRGSRKQSTTSYSSHKLFPDRSSIYEKYDNLPSCR